MDDNMDIIEIRGRRYYHSTEDDAWYPVPTKFESDFNQFIVWLSGLCTVIMIIWAVMRYFGYDL